MSQTPLDISGTLVETEEEEEVSDDDEEEEEVEETPKRKVCDHCGRLHSSV